MSTSYPKISVSPVDINVHPTKLLILLLLALASPLTVLGNQDPTETQEITNSTSTDIDEASQPGTKKPKKEKKAKDPNRARILPIPIFITEPAIGEGLGLALAYFHRTKDVPEGTTIASPSTFGEVANKQAPPPTVTGIMAAYTSNGTAAVGIGHMNTFKQDHIRFTGVIARADVNSTFYLLDQPLKFNLKGSLAYQDTRFRFGDSRWFWGIGLSYLDASSAFKVDFPEDVPFDEESSDLFRHKLKNVGLSAKFAWDTRDNTSMPNTGQLFDFAGWRYDEAIGGDYDYWDARFKLLSFHQLHEKFVLGLRLEYSVINGSAPFFAIPWVTLRGIPALRYQGKRVGVFEVEGRYNLTPKWALIGFAGTGKVYSDIAVIDTDQSIYNYGIGGRYKIFDAQNVWVGIDIAKGPEEFNWYIQVGHAW
jgi:hypothetical protein